MRFNTKLVVSTLIVSCYLFSPLFITEAAIIPPIKWEQKGITIRLVDESIDEVNKSLGDLAETGANYVTITPGWHTDNLNSSNVDRKDRTPSDELLVYTIEKAHSMNLKVFMKPHVDPKTGDWRAKMDPTDKQEFFKNYKNMLLKYAQMSETYHVEEFSIGSELFKLSTNPDNEEYWQDIIANIRNIYKGKLTYNANVGDTSFDESVLPFWNQLDYIGLSMYQPLADTNNPSLEEVLINWKILDKNYIEPLEREYDKPVIFTEIGYRSMDGAAQDPGDYKISSKVDLNEQKIMYEALFTYWQNRPHVIGLHLWDWKVYDNPGGSKDIDYTPQNKPALEILTQAFGGTLDGMSSENIVDETVVEAIDAINNKQIPKILISDGLVLYEGQELAKIQNPSDYEFAETQSNSEFYVDRDYEITEVPTELKESVILKTKNSDKNSNSLTQTVIEFFDKALIFTAYDSRAIKTPNWLKEWTPLDKVIKTEDATFNLFAKEINKETITLGGNKEGGETEARSNYFAFVSKFADIFNVNANINYNEAKNDISSDQNIQETSDIDLMTEDVLENVLGAISEMDETENIVVPTEAIEVEKDSALKGELTLEYPENAAIISGEKKIKVKIPGVLRESYSAKAIVDGEITYELEDSSSDDIKQAKIEFDEWDWKGSGPYNVEIVAKDLDGNTIDTLNFKLFVKH